MSEKRGAQIESRKRKRDVHSSACPNGMRRSAIVSWTYSDTEGEEPEILREDVTVIHENDQFFACAFPEKSTTAAKRIRCSVPPPQERHMDVSNICAWESRNFASGFDIDLNTHVSRLMLALLLLSIIASP